MSHEYWAVVCSTLVLTKYSQIESTSREQTKKRCILGQHLRRVDSRRFMAEAGVFQCGEMARQDQDAGSLQFRQNNRRTQYFTPCIFNLAFRVHD
jgi:hypothetical protein